MSAPVFYLDLVDKGVGALWPLTDPVPYGKIESGKKIIFEETTIRRSSPYQEGQALPPRKCTVPDCIEGVIDTQDGPTDCICEDGFEPHTSGPVTVVQPVTFIPEMKLTEVSVLHALGAFVSKISHKEPNPFLCFTIAIPTKVEVKG